MAIAALAILTALALGVAHFVYSSIRVERRQKAVEAAREGQLELWRHVIDSMPVLVDARDDDGRIIVWNRECERVTGYSAEEIGHHPNAMEALYPDSAYRASIIERWEESRGEYRDWELELTCKDGSRRIISWSSVPELPSSPGTSSWDIGVDVTERRSAERVQAVLLQIAEAPAVTDNLAELIQAIHAELSKLIDSQNFYVALYDEASASFECPYYTDDIDEIGWPGRFMAKGTLTDYVRRSGRPLFVDESIHRELAESGEAELVGTDSAIWMGAPLRTRNRVIGVVVVQSYQDSNLYTQRDLGLLAFVSDHIAQAIARQQAEERQRASEERFRIAFETSPDSISINRLEDGLYVSVNPGFTAQTGYEQDDVLGMSTGEVGIWIDLKDRDHVRAALSSSGSLSNFEAEFRAKDGRILTGLMLACIMMLDGAPHILSIVRDITDWKKAELAALESERRFKELTDLLPQAVFEIDIDGQVQYTNRQGLEFTGYTREDVTTGLHFLKLFDDAEHKLLLQRCHDIIGGQAGTGAEYTLIRKDGSRANVMVYANRIVQEGVPVGLRGIVADITDLKRLQEFAHRAQRLETAGRIAGQVAHDFNNLLGPLVAYPELVMADLPPDHTTRKFLRDMQSAATQISEINQQLLTLGRRGHYTQDAVDLNDIVRAAVGQLSNLSPTLDIAVELEPQLPPIRGGKAQLDRLVANLLANARDAMQDIGLLTVATKSCRYHAFTGSLGRIPGGRYVRVTVADSGVGIPPEVLPRMFDPFFTTKAADHRRGSGLGLSIVNAVVEDHHGYIDCHTASGEGTTFHIYLPVVTGEVIAEATDNVVGGSESILVIDDDAAQLEVTRVLLEKLGYAVAVAGTGEAGLEQLRRQPFDLLVLDMVSPVGLDGAETFRWARGLRPLQKAIIVSGYAETDRVELALDLGAASFLRKPLTLKSLARAVREALDRTVPPTRASALSEEKGTIHET